MPASVYKLRGMADISKDEGVEVTFTEGQFSAAIACYFGIKCLALTGVWNFTSKNCGYDFLPELETWAWAGRRVVLCWDSDVMTKAGVAQALAAFSAQLKARGATVFTKILPSEPNGEKNGIDDFLLRHGRAAYDALPAPESTADLEKLTAKSRDAEENFKRLDARFLWVEKLRAVYDSQEHAAMKVREFLDSFKEYKHWEDNKEGAGQHKVYDAPLWHETESRHKVSDLVCEPGEPQRFLRDGRLVYNVDHGAMPNPIRGEGYASYILLWNRLMEHLFRNDKKARATFEKIIAWQRRHVGVKIPIATFLWGPEGAGKTLVGRVIGALYGGHSGRFQEMDEETLKDKYGDWAVSKCFALVDELFTGDSKAVANRYKNLISRVTRRIEGKYSAVYWIRDTMNYHFTSNDFDALKIEGSGRRWFVHEVTQKIKDTRSDTAARTRRMLRHRTAAKRLEAQAADAGRVSRARRQGQSWARRARLLLLQWSRA